MPSFINIIMPIRAEKEFRAEDIGHAEREELRKFGSSQ